MTFFETLDYFDICLLAFCIFEAYLIYKLLKKKTMEEIDKPKIIEVTMNEKITSPKFGTTISQKTITIHEPLYFGSCIVRSQFELDRLISDLQKVSEKKFFDVQ